MNTGPILTAMCGATLLAVVYLVATRPAADDGRIAELERRLAAAEKRADSTDALRDELAGIARRLDRGAASGPTGGTEAAAHDASSGAPAAASSRKRAEAEPEPARPIEDVIADRVEKKIAEKMDAMAARQKDRGADGKWKPPIDELAKELALTDAQKAEAAKIFDSARDKGFVLLRTQRLDGGTLLDDFAAALKNGGDAEEATKGFFQRILTEKVPGSDQTYFAEFLAIHQDVHERLTRQIGKEKIKRLDSLAVDLLDVKTGYDPVGDYIKAKLQ